MDMEILKKQREFFRSGGTLSVNWRLELLKRLREEICGRQEEISAALAEDLGKSKTEAYMTEIGMALSGLSCTIRNVKKWAKPRSVRTPLAQFPASSKIIPEPYGNVLVMSPWNYPFLLCMAPLASAVAAGNTVILKPSAYSPATSAAVMMGFDWRMGLCCLVIFVVVVAATRYVSLASTLLSAALIVEILIFYPGRWDLFILIVLYAGFAIYRHRANIGRLLAGTESKLGQKVEVKK